VYKKLLYFWKVILDKTQYTTWGVKTENFDGDDDNLYPDKEDKPTAHMKKELQNMLYDIFIANMLKIIQQLNLHVIPKKEETAAEENKEVEDQDTSISNKSSGFLVCHCQRYQQQAVDALGVHLGRCLD